MQKKFERNVKLYYIYFVASRISFLVPILILFWQSFGLSFTEIAFISSAFAVSVLLFEVPTGALADTMGRKKSIVASALLGVSYPILMSLPIFFNIDAFWIFVFAYFLIGIGVALGSGADSALFYDTLKKLKKEKEFSSHFSKFASKMHYFRAVIVIIGGILGYISLNIPVLIQIIPATLTFIVALGFTETDKSSKNVRISSQLEKIKRGLTQIYKNKALLWIVLFSASFFAFSVMATEYDEIFLREAGVPIFLFGFLFATSDFIKGYLLSKSDKFVDKWKNKSWAILSLIPSVVFILYFVTENLISQIIILSLFFLFVSLMSLSENLFETAIHDNTESNIRATVFSVKSMIMNLLYLIIPIFGFLTDKFGLIISTKIFSIISLLVLFVIIIFKPTIKTKKHIL